ncbi:MAG TPA: RIO1 family regulatory kinase/ATPase [Nitrososphaerales archaeon]|nr:RIO1 family regulatory kinase/ATPase [Nitrososphaerales archaeon]
MSSVERASRVLKSLKDEEWKTLVGIERASSAHGTSDGGMISRLSRLPTERVSFALGQLEKKGLVRRRGLSFVLLREGVEAMALREYVKRDLVAALGAIIAKGKESDVYEAYTEEGGLYALKFFKLGRTSFTSVRKKRFREGADMKSWIAVNYEAARREYSALKKLEGLAKTFPKAYSYSRSTVLLEQLSGFRLSERPELSDPRSTLLAVLESVRLAYVKAGLINADLSEYNILTDGASTWLIDWPQAVDRSHPNSPELLRHDVGAVVGFFGRAYRVQLDLDAAYGFVKGERLALE